MSAQPPLALTDDLTIYHALEQKNTLLDALQGTTTLELDLMNVHEIDTSGLQLLILLKKEAHKAGKQVTIVAHSQAVCAAIDFCNLATELGDPLVIPAAETA